MADDIDDDPIATQGPLGPAAIVGLVAGAVPFFIHLGTSSTVVVNGEVVESTSTDYVALGGGGVAIIAGIAAILTAKNAGANKPKAMMVGAGVIALGVFQLLRGAGIL